MSRCAYCRHLIWPWQRRGWLFVGTVRSWHHFDCWRRRMAEAAAAIKAKRLTGRDAA